MQGMQKDPQGRVWLMPPFNAGGQLLRPEQRGLRGFAEHRLSLEIAAKLNMKTCGVVDSRPPSQNPLSPSTMQLPACLSLQLRKMRRGEGIGLLEVMRQGWGPHLPAELIPTS